MRRREFITFVGAALAAYPPTVGAQQNDRARRIAVLIGVEDDAEGQARLAAFRKGMRVWVGAKGATYRWRSALALATPIGRGPMAQT